MCKCEIQWIDEQGKPTPDQNEAVMLAQFHQPIYAPFSTRVIEYSSLIQGAFPICAQHYARVTHEMRFPRGGWTFVELQT